MAGPIWLGHDEVIWLREWATHTVHHLPGADATECLVGSDPSVELPLVDPKGFVSRRHALVRRVGAFWHMMDNDSKNGISVDGKLRDRFPLVPGAEIRIGSLTLVAENRALVHLREYLARVLGWDAPSRRTVDLALGVIRNAADRSTPLVIAGADDLVAVARQIHLRTTAPGAPFVVCGPQPRKTDVRLRVTARLADATAACERAAGGTVCVRGDELPTGFDHLIAVSQDRCAPVQLIVCDNENATAPPIIVPTLAQRSGSDIERIVTEYASDSIRELGASPASFTEANREWVTAHEATSFAKIEIATLRTVALNEAGNIHRAAARLGVSHVSLGNWFRRRGIKA